MVIHLNVPVRNMDPAIIAQALRVAIAPGRAAYNGALLVVRPGPRESEAVSGALLLRTLALRTAGKSAITQDLAI